MLKIRELRFLMIVPDLDTELDLESLKPLIDAQTSGGLLVSLPDDSVESYLTDVSGAVRIGRVVAGSGIRLI